MDEFCNSTFWNTTLTWNTNEPDFTDCFKKTILVWIPFVMAIFGVPIEMIYAIRSTRRDIPFSRLIKIRMALTLALIVMCITEYLSSSSDILTKQATIVKVSSYFLILSSTITNRYYGVRTSSVTFLFFLFTLICEFPHFYLNVAKNREEFYLIHGLSYVINFGLFILSFFIDEKPRLSCIINQKNTRAEEYSFISRCLHLWFDRMGYDGFRNRISFKSLSKMDYVYTCEYITPRFEEHLGNLKEVRCYSLILAVFKTFYSSYFMIFIWAILEMIPIFLAPYVLRMLIGYISGNEPTWRGYFYSCLLTLISLMRSYSNSYYKYNTDISENKISTALLHVIYKKVLKMGNCTKSEYTIGKILSVMSTDVERVGGLLWIAVELVTIPVQLFLAFFLIFRTLGPAVFYGLAAIFIIVPICLYVTWELRRATVLQMKIKDKRLKFLQEVISGIRVIKFNVWEESVKEKLKEIRKHETDAMKKQAYLRSFNQFLMECVPLTVTIVSFIAYEKIWNRSLDTKNAFLVVSLTNALKGPIAVLPRQVEKLVWMYVSTQRISHVLTCDEVESITKVNEESAAENVLVVNDGTFSCGVASPYTLLRNINTTIKRGSLVAVTGNVGSGKSSLLMAYLKEIHCSRGSIDIMGKISYSAQEPWILQTTIRENVTLGQPLNRNRYRAVINACALAKDLDSFPEEDLTEIGEKGVNLSSGQKQRIGLARSVYHEADIYLLDDPMSTVDVNIAKHIFREAIVNMLQKKTRVIVTNDVTHIRLADWMIVMENGTISKQGKPQEILTEEFVKLSKNQKQESGLESEIDGKDYQCNGESNNDLGRKFIEDERTEKGQVKWDVLIYFLKCVGFFTFFTILVIFIASEVSGIFMNNWLMEWSKNKTTAKDMVEYEKNSHLLYFSIFGIGQEIIIQTAYLTLLISVLSSTLILHNNMLNCVMNWSCYQFDVTPLGRIINRFSSDLNKIEDMLGRTIYRTLKQIFAILSIMYVVSSTTPTFMSIMVPLVIFFCFIERFFVAVYREVARLKSAALSPLYSHFEGTMCGIESIRSFNLQEKYLLNLEKIVDKFQICSYYLAVARAWTVMRLGVIEALIIFSSALFTVINKDNLSAGLVAISLTYAIKMTGKLNTLVKAAFFFEVQLVDVERIKEYTYNSQENIISSSSNTPQWTNKGEIMFDHYYLRYGEKGEPVLKDVTFSIQGMEKVGIVGRTGCGKTSLTLGLLRMVEACAGRIIIDGIDISTIPVNQLRQYVTIIPQNPVIFSGTIRFNLDPENKHSDIDVWNAVKLSHLTPFVTSQHDGLNCEIHGGSGCNLSVGQKQLLCLARALLRKTKILILDEATSSLDSETNQLIQQTVKDEFKHCTVLVVANRLNNIMDCSRTIVMKDGCVVRVVSSPSRLS